MTNTFFQVVIWVLWSTNRMDTLLTPSGDEIMRSTIVSQSHIYNLPGFPTVTNVVPVFTNSVHLKQKWVEAEPELPPVPLRELMKNSTYQIGPAIIETNGTVVRNFLKTGTNRIVLIPNQ